MRCFHQRKRSAFRAISTLKTHPIRGQFSHGFHDGHLMFTEDDVLIMIMAAVPEPLVKPVLQRFAPFYNEDSGVVFISDIHVTRLVKFGD